MLVEHRTDLKREIKKLQEHLENLNEKIDYYQSEINNKSGDKHGKENHY